MRVELVAVTRPLGFITIEEFIIQCARVSSPDNRDNHETAPKLLAYLMQHQHWSPFEMVNFAVEIETSRAISAQLCRHRSFSFQEFSQRYAKVENLEYVELRKQADKNRQSSLEVIDTDAEMYDGIADKLAATMNLYKDLLANGVAKECARMVLPMCTQTTIVMNGTLRSWIHFLQQRCDEHAQKEIREIAFAIRNELIAYVPWTAAALKWERV